MNILSICGGGARGLIPLYTLREIENKCNKPIVNLFDYYAGSSIGSVIISALLLSDDGINPKYTCDELYEKIETLCKKIFSTNFYRDIQTVYGFFGSKYSVETVNTLLKEFFGDKKMKDLLKSVCFPSFDGNSLLPIYFTKETHGELLLRDVLRATTAAPTYFDAKEMIINDKKYVLYDSGVACNNTAMNAELYATQNIKILDKSKIYELCLGTGKGVTHPPTNNGLFGWMSSIIGYLFAGYNENEMCELYLALNKDNILFVNFEIDSKYDQLDNATEEALKYYTEKIKEWIYNNNDSFFAFIDKLVNNHN